MKKYIFKAQDTPDPARNSPNKLCLCLQPPEQFQNKNTLTQKDDASIIWHFFHSSAKEAKIYRTVAQIYTAK